MTSPAFSHAPVLLEEVLSGLAPAPGAMVLDATVGGAGHAEALLRVVLPDGYLYGLDQDPMALAAAEARLGGISDRFKLLRANFSQLGSLALPPMDCILMDIGVSSPQLDTAARGFSFQQAGPLDMRMDPDSPVTAAALIQHESEAELARIFFEYGEERYSRRIAKLIVEKRQETPFIDTLSLAELVRKNIPRDPSGIHSATRVFQALRIAVNNELGALKSALPAAIALLKPGGRLGVISFHSLEDRIVKQFFKQESRGCLCPPKQPLCTCKHTPILDIMTPKPLVAGPNERDCNPRARSAKLRIARRVSP